ncbi:DNA topoisomerase IB [Alteromonas ponticola]|uniref:DNA topoisomerase n=1 Tax=Alteromonas aquimaris TaxID=2998417 RepID=A0ABT3P742_9ALTE|nr:DNA topoisomerase IB [Alteromonas aquimaris]MCW8108598.1 DNA topoisomerase IB [Alteromonas aquimaris]
MGRINMESVSLDILRKRRGKGFEYFYESGKKVTDKKLLKRIDGLVIPPIWKNVQISRSPTQHLQAVGYDTKGRKQYLYHENWHKARQQEKFAKLSDFGSGLPEFRKYCWSHVHEQQWTMDKTLSLVTLLLDHTGLRAGNRQYTEQNNTYGITTLRRKHVYTDGGAVRLNFIGKHNKDRNVEIENPQLADLVSQSAEQRGYALFRFMDDEGRWHDVDSDDVNHFIHTHLGNDYSCKDFRTWAACRFGLFSLPSIKEMVSQSPRRKWSTTLTKHVASMLGNTPAVCQQYYLHPKLYEVVESRSERETIIRRVAEYAPENILHDNAVSATERLLSQIIAIQ